MKFSKRVLLKLKNKIKNLKPDKYKRLKRESLIVYTCQVLSFYFYF